MSQYVRQRWGVENGFPRGPVYSISQTTDGYLWIGTEKGLIRFDGLNFHVIESQTSEAADLTHVLGLFADGDGSLWTRLRRPTLLRYRGGTFEGVSNRLAAGRDSTVQGIGRAADGSVLLWATSGGGVAAFRGERLEKIADLRDFSRSPVLSLAQTANGDVWVGTRDSGLFRVTGNYVAAIRQGLPDSKVNALVAVGNELWVGTDSGVVKWDGTKLTSAGLPGALNSVQALAMIVDRDSNLWIGTNSSGLLRVKAGGAASLDKPASGPIEAVTALFEDREGNLWIGSQSGLERLSDSAFVTYSLPEGLPTEGNNPVFADRNNRIWFPPTAGGLWWFANGQHGQIHEDGLDRDVVYSLDGRPGELWLGRQHGGLTVLRFEGNTTRAHTYTHKDGLVQDSVYSVFRSRDGTVWAGTLSGGVSRFRDGRFTNYTTSDGLVSNAISSILQTSDGTMWFATPGGLSALAGDRWKSYDQRDGLPAESVSSMREDSSGILWVGTSRGLAFRASGGFKTPAGIIPMLREPVLGLEEDRQGSLWIATSSHVLRVNRDKLLHGTLGLGDVRVFGLADGLRGVEGVSRHRSVVSDEMRRIWFSLDKGISVVDPNRLGRSSMPAIAHVEAVLADGRAIGFNPPLHIPGGRRRITFQYAGLSLAAPELVRFRYRLDGFDKTWSEPVAAREAGYTNLGPGSYRFRLLASNPDGVWISTEATLPFVVDPLFYQAWWFQACGILAVGLGAVAWYRIRLRRVTRQLNLRFEERLAERTRIAQELHDTLLQGFLSASMQVHVATDSLPAGTPAKSRLDRALQLMRQVVDEGRNAVRGLRSTTNPSLDLEHAFSSIRMETGETGRTQPDLRVLVDGQARPLHPLLRDEVYRIGREAVMNALRHGHATHVDVELKYSARRLRLLVRDDGCGIDSKILSSGRDGHWGLIGMRERAKRIGARLEIWSSTASGTEVDLSVPGRVAYVGHRSFTLRSLPKLFSKGRVEEETGK